MATGRKSDFTLPTFDSIFSTQEERDEAKLAKIRDIPISEIDDFPDHPFKVRDDEDMLQLVESVKERGVITPATVRQAKHEKPDDEKVQKILEKYGTVEDESIFSQYIECFRSLLAGLVLESYDVAAYVYQKRCVEKLSIEEIMENTRLSREALNMFVRYFDARQKTREFSQ